ncbi:2-hydroxy-acid oxidase [Labrys miyagiensis]|uniref:2-hydroxy-acid oxidase n=1 Tax=Labrys miyagiensis TaxID=346912 RepID=A0ABQ6CEK7_9HYPH|nr:glycolate oxidase subunit GlcE [Labrys miyagiensis]GLS17099.1 2-hydroxy-acid oxidase [Labrys miyagiensis]
MTMTHAPTTEAALADIVTESFRTKTPLVIVGGGSKDGIGRPINAAPLSTKSLTGITLYEPAEMVISALSGTPLAELTGALDERGQMLPFEPADWRGLLGSGPSEPTVGGLVAANLSGPRRITAGACRDSLMGVRFVNGKGEAIKSGGRVMKNVTGYDLTKLMAGSWGTLGILTEVTFKVLPKPEASAGLVWQGLDDAKAVELMSAGLGSPFEVSAAAHIPADLASGTAQTVLRLENFESSIAYRREKLATLLKRFGSPDHLDSRACQGFWWQIADVAPFAQMDGAVWRLSVAPSKAVALVRALRRNGEAKLFYDWGGGLIWLLAPETVEMAKAIAAAAKAQGGHAMLIRASADYRAESFAFGQQDGPIAALSARVKQAFDPANILNTGRLGG